MELRLLDASTALLVCTGVEELAGNADPVSRNAPATCQIKDKDIEMK